jgi:hypothetical protein
LLTAGSTLPVGAKPDHFDGRSWLQAFELAASRDGNDRDIDYGFFE